MKPWSPRITSRPSLPWIVSPPCPPRIRSSSRLPCDRVGGAVLRLLRLDALDPAGGLDLLRLRGRADVAVRPDDRRQDVLLDVAVVAEDDVGEVARRAGQLPAPSPMQRVPAGDQAVGVRRRARVGGRDRQLAADHVDVDARVAVDLVDAARARGSRRRRSRPRGSRRPGCRSDQVVARAAVGGEPDGRQRAGRSAGEQRAGVDHVVAGVAIRGRDREEEARRAVADLVGERLEAEVARSTARSRCRCTRCRPATCRRRRRAASPDRRRR